MEAFTGSLTILPIMSLLCIAFLFAASVSECWPLLRSDKTSTFMAQLFVILLTIVWANFIAFYCYTDRGHSLCLKASAPEAQLFFIVLFTSPLFWHLQKSLLQARANETTFRTSFRLQLRFTTTVIAAFLSLTIPLTQELLFIIFKIQPYQAVCSDRVFTWSLVFSIPLIIIAFVLRSTSSLAIPELDPDHNPKLVTDSEITFETLKFFNGNNVNESSLQTKSIHALEQLEAYALYVRDLQKAELIASVISKRQDSGDAYNAHNS
jgi:hypothetical protein